MSATFSQMIDETQQHLRSFVNDQELSTWLKFPVAADATTLQVNDATVIGRGRIEIGNELLIVESVDENLSTFSVPPYGRGADGTTPSAHAAGSKVTVAPLFPRKSVADSLNHVIRAVGDQLFGVRTVSLTAHPTRVSYELPADTERVLSVAFRYDTVTRDLHYAREWSFDQDSDWPTGKGLLIYDYPRPGEPIRVVTAVDPIPLVEGDDFADSLLPASAWDVIVLGATARLVSTTAAAIMATRSVGAQTTLTGSGIEPMSPLQISRYFSDLHEKRLQEEVQRLLNSFANRIHYQRRG